MKKLGKNMISRLLHKTYRGYVGISGGNFTNTLSERILKSNNHRNNIMGDITL